MTIPHQEAGTIDVYFWCDKKVQRRTFMACPHCEFFPCAQLRKDDIRALRESPLMDKTFKGLERNRIKSMHIVKYRDGSMAVVKIDEKNPDPSLISQVEEVYCVNKVLVPVYALKVKPKEERARITKALASGDTEASAPEEPIKKTRTRRKA